MGTDYEILEDSVRNSYASVSWSHKIQEKQADLYFKRYKIAVNCNLIAAVLASVGATAPFVEFVATLFNPNIIKILTIICSFITALTSGYLKLNDLKQMAENNKNAARELIIIRDQLKIILLQIKMKNKQANQLLIEYEDIMNKLDKIYQSAPTTTNKAVELANVALKVKGDNSFTDNEIDFLLPKNLRKENPYYE